MKKHVLTGCTHLPFFARADNGSGRFHDACIRRLGTILSEVKGTQFWTFGKTRTTQASAEEVNAAIRLSLLGEGLDHGGKGGILWEWRQPHLMFDLYGIVADEEAAEPLMRSLLASVLRVEGASVEGLRFSSKENRQHLDALDPQVVQKWQGLVNHPFDSKTCGPETGDWMGTNDVETMMMMGEDMRTCMGIDRGNKRTVKGLLSYMAAANVRLLCASPALPPSARVSTASVPPTDGEASAWLESVASTGKVYYYNPETLETSWGPTAESAASSTGAASHDGVEYFDGAYGRRGKWRARVVTRLLQRRDTGETVLYCDRPYHAGERDADAERQLRQRAQALAAHLGVALHYACDEPLPPESIRQLGLPPPDSFPYPTLELVDVAGVSPYVWRDGRYQVGLVFRNEMGDTKIQTSLGGNRVAVGILFGGWCDSLDVYEASLESAGPGDKGRGATTTLMRDVQRIGGALATDARTTQTLKRAKKNPWDLGF